MVTTEDWHWWYAGLHDLVLRVVRCEVGRAGHSLNILDAGCGTGRLCQLMQPLGAVSGCDMHPLALEATAQRGIRAVWRCDLARDDMGAGTHDIITCMDVLYHRAVVNENLALQKLHHALKRGGLLILQTAAFECLRGAHDKAVHTRRRYRCREIVRLLTDTGFTIEFATYRLPVCFVPMLLWRRFSRLLTRRPDMAFAIPPWVNGLLTTLVKMENHLICAGVRFPLGTSVFAVARK